MAASEPALSAEGPGSRAALAFPRAELLLAGAIALVFGITLTFPFLYWDDIDLVVDNPLLRLTPDNLAAIWTRPVEGLYTPLSYTLWSVLAAVFGREAWAFHALNLGLHLLAAIGCFHLLRGLTGRPSASLLAALLWALHPLQAEPVAWISGMNNLLAGALSLWALTALLADRPRLLLASLLFALALLSKPTAVVVPALATLLLALRPRLPRPPAPPPPHPAHPTPPQAPDLPDRSPHVGASPPERSAGPASGPRRASVWLLLGWFVLAAAAAAIGRTAQPVPEDRRTPLAARPLVALDAIGFHTARVFVPTGLSVDLGRTPDRIIARGHLQPYPLLGLAVVAATVAGLARRSPWSLPPALLLVGLAPTLGLIDFAFQEVSTVASRYAYLALLGPALALAYAPLRPGLAAVAAAAALCFLAVLPWRDTATLMQRAQRLNPDGFLAPRTLAFLAARDGRRDEALRLYHEALQRRPGDVVTHFALGNLALADGRPDAARHHFDTALPGAGPALRVRLLTNRGIARSLLDDLPGAEADFRAAIADDPAAPEPLANLARLLELRGDLDSARDLYRRALDLDPNLDLARRGLQRLGP